MSAEFPERKDLLDLPLKFRPRQKILRRGGSALSPTELLALILGTGDGAEPVTDLARRLVRRHGIRGLASLSPSDWREERGVGAARIARLCAVFEIARRAYGREERSERPRIHSPGHAFRQVRHLCKAKKEHLVGLYLDVQNGLVHRETISIGSLNTTRAHPREILHPAIEHLAVGFILIHNHPSGCPDPSAEDVEFTRGIRRAAELVGIELYDHLIVAGRGYTSLRERGLMGEIGP